MSGPHRKAKDYICDAVIGRKQPYSNVKADAANIRANQQGGSGNWPIQIAAGAAINEESEGQDLAPFLRGENGWGLNGNEHGSSIYETWNAASIVAVLNKAPSYQDGQRRADAQRWLKAQIAKYCLGLKLHRPTRSILYVQNENQFQPEEDPDWGLTPYPPDGWSYPTNRTDYGMRLYPVMPGSRQLERFSRNESSRPQEATFNLDRSQMAPFIAWALGYSGRKFPDAPIRSRNLDRGWGWPIWLMEQSFGGIKFESGVEPEKFGLTAEDVSRFRGFLEDRQDPGPLMSYLAGYTPTEGQECHWIQLVNGDLVSWFNKTIHNSTTGCPLTWTEGDKVFWASPQSTVRTSGNCSCRRENNHFVVSATGNRASTTRSFRPPQLADSLWEVVWDHNGFGIVDDDQEVLRFDEHDAVISEVGALIRHYREGSPDRGFLEIVGELINRQGGHKGKPDGFDPIPPRARRREVVEAAEKARLQADVLPPLDDHYEEHRTLSGLMFELLQHYPDGGPDRELLEAVGEMMARQGARRAGDPLDPEERPPAVVEAADAVNRLSLRLT